MVLCISEKSILRDAIQATLTQEGHPVHVAAPAHDDLFGLAFGPVALTLYDRLASQPAA
jgi:hypothetical protein